MTRTRLERELDRSPAKSLASEADVLATVAIRCWGDDAPRVLARAAELVAARVAEWTPRTPPAFTPAPEGDPPPVENGDSGAGTALLEADPGEGRGEPAPPGLFDALTAGAMDPERGPS